MVVALLRAKSEACPPGSAAGQPGPRAGGIPAAVLAKEAVYNAAGVGAYDLHDYIDFGSWLHSTLLPVRHSAHSCLHCPAGSEWRPCQQAFAFSVGEGVRNCWLPNRVVVG